MSYRSLLQAIKNLTRPRGESQENQPVPTGGLSPLTDWQRLDRFLKTGTETGEIHAGPPRLTLHDCPALVALLATEGEAVLDRVKLVAGSLQAVRDDYGIFAWAAAASVAPAEVRALALKGLPQICRTSSQLFRFIEGATDMRGWGRSFRKGISTWYTEADADELALQAVRMGSGEGWAHRDVMRLAHPRARSVRQRSLFEWMTSGEGGDDFPVIEAAKKLAAASSASEAASLIRQHRLPRSWVPSALIGEPEVWAALLEGMTYAEVLANLGNMTVSGWVASGSEGEARVVERLVDPSRIRRSRTCVLSLMSEAQGYLKGGWSPSRRVVAALEEAAEELLRQIERRDRRIWLGVDASPSMSSGSLAGASITPRQAAFGLAAAADRMGELVKVSALGEKVKPLSVPRGALLREALEASQESAIGASNCCLPMVQAAAGRVAVDVFLVVTDEAAWPGEEGPIEALRRYRAATGIPASLILVSLRGKHLAGGLKEDPAAWHLDGWDASTCRAIEAAFSGD